MHDLGAYIDHSHEPFVSVQQCFVLPDASDFDLPVQGLWQICSLWHSRRVDVVDFCWSRIRVLPRNFIAPRSIARLTITFQLTPTTHLNSEVFYFR